MLVQAHSGHAAVGGDGALAGLSVEEQEWSGPLPKAGEDESAVPPGEPVMVSIAERQSHPSLNPAHKQLAPNLEPLVTSRWRGSEVLLGPWRWPCAHRRPRRHSICAGCQTATGGPRVDSRWAADGLPRAVGVVSPSVKGNRCR